MPVAVPFPERVSPSIAKLALMLAEIPGGVLALKKLAAIEPAKAKLVELRYFGGLTGEQAAEVLGISPTTADRHWAYARAWLQTEIQRR